MEIKKRIKVGMFMAPDPMLPYNKLLIDSLAKRIEMVLLESLSKKWVYKNQKKLDIIHFQWTMPFFTASSKINAWKQVIAFIYFLFFLKREGYKIVWTVHNIHPHDKSIFPYYWGDFFLSHCADAVIVHAESTKKELKRWYGRSSKNVYLIPFSTYKGYSEAYEYGYPPKKARTELDLPKDKFIYLFFGYVRKYKGIDILIKAFQKAKQDNGVLLIVGGYWTDVDKAEIEKVVKNDPNIILHTKEMDDKCVQQHMAAADVVVLPYRKITTSGVLVLALTFGKPIIAVKKGMLPEWVSAENGIVVETEQDLQRALHDIQRKDLKAMGEVSYTLSQKYPWSKVATLYEEVYENILYSKKEQEEKNDFGENNEQE